MKKHTSLKVKALSAILLGTTSFSGVVARAQDFNFGNLFSSNGYGTRAANAFAAYQRDPSLRGLASSIFTEQNADAGINALLNAGGSSPRTVEQVKSALNAINQLRAGNTPNLAEAISQQLRLRGFTNEQVQGFLASANITPTPGTPAPFHPPLVWNPNQEIASDAQRVALMNSQRSHVAQITSVTPESQKNATLRVPAPLRSYNEVLENPEIAQFVVAKLNSKLSASVATINLVEPGFANALHTTTNIAGQLAGLSVMTDTNMQAQALANPDKEDALVGMEACIQQAKEGGLTHQQAMTRCGGDTLTVSPIAQTINQASPEQTTAKFETLPITQALRYSGHDDIVTAAKSTPTEGRFELYKTLDAMYQRTISMHGGREKAMISKSLQGMQSYIGDASITFDLSKPDSTTGRESVMPSLLSSPQKEINKRTAAYYESLVTLLREYCVNESSKQNKYNSNSVLSAKFASDNATLNEFWLGATDGSSASVAAAREQATRQGLTVATPGRTAILAMLSVGEFYFQDADFKALSNKIVGVLPGATMVHASNAGACIALIKVEDGGRFSLPDMYRLKNGDQIDTQNMDQFQTAVYVVAHAIADAQVYFEAALLSDFMRVMLPENSGLEKLGDLGKKLIKQAFNPNSPALEYNIAHDYSAREKKLIEILQSNRAELSNRQR